jgi:PBSX family phage terminase large subunit
MGSTFEVASPKFNPLFTLKNPETGERPNHIVLPGGRASAKTVSASLAVIYHMRNKRLYKLKRGLRVVVARQFGSSIDESFWSELENAATLMGVWHEFTWGNKVITHKPTGSTITSIGLERNKGNIKGLAQVDLVVVEEAAYVTSESIETLVPTIRKNFSVIMWLYNPMNRNDAVAQKFVECETPYPKTLIIETNWRDNKFLSERAIADKDALELADPIAFRNVYEGEYMGAEDNVLIKPVVIDEARKCNPVRNDSLKITAGFDVSGMGKDVSVIVRRRGKEILSVHKKAKGNTQEMTDWAKQIYVSHGWDIVVVDATGSSGVADNLHMWGNANRTFQTIAWMASWKSRDPNRYANARTESWCIMRDWLKTGGSLDNDKCWDELSNITFVYKDREQVALESKKKLAKSPDEPDALAMSLWVPDEAKVVTIAKPIRRGGGFIG